MRLTTIAVALLLGATAAHAQRPEDTEVWTPVPRIVAPGATPSTAPSDAIVLFDGRSLGAWVSANDAGPAKWTVADGALIVNKPAGDIETRRRFGAYQLHVEWRIPTTVTGSGQLRGNSGVFLAVAPDVGYELQIMDSYHNDTYVNGQAASVYKQYAPLVNAAKPPGEWQTYDIVWHPPTFNADGSLATPATITAFHNGILVQDHVALKGGTRNTGLPEYHAHGAAPIRLQAHGDPSPPISFRNIWVRPLDGGQ